MFILAVDPGVTTGIAGYNYNLHDWYTDQLPFEPIKLYNFFMQHIGSRVMTTVICERFDYRPVGKYNFGGSRAIPKVDLTPREVIGILKLACAFAGNEIVWQAPGDVNGQQGDDKKDTEVFWTDARVKTLGLYKPAHVHAMDAVKHILYYRSFTLKENELFFPLRPGYKGHFEETMT
jgi:hypothetical protein